MTGEAFKALTGAAAIVDVEQKRKGRAMILCLDKSGSMSGRPYDALKEGALQVGKSIFESREFERFITVFYDSSVKIVE
jgi:uncharacterized protein with von Willebrand factor type A (vWA) domain